MCLENNFPKSLPPSLCPPGQRPSWAGGQRGGILSPLEKRGRCEKIAQGHQVGQGYWKSFTAALFFRQAAAIKSFNRVDGLRRFVTHTLLNNPQL